MVLVTFILIMTPKVGDALRPGPAPKLDYVGSVLSAAGLGLFVFGVLKSSSWGWLKPKNAPFTIFGFSPTLYVMAAGAALIWGFVAWQRNREERRRDPLVHLSLVRIPTVRAGLIGLFSQNLILMGVFFVIPLYLQLVLGLTALETGIKMLPVSITMFVTSAIGSRLVHPVSGAHDRAGWLGRYARGTLILLATIQPTLSSAGFALGMAVLGVGMGLMVSQLGNVVQSSVEESGRSEAGGLQYTGQQLGSSLGLALIGAIVLMGLASTFISNVEKDPRISSEVAAQVSVASGTEHKLCSGRLGPPRSHGAGLDDASASALVEDYEAAQLLSLKAGLLAAGLLALISLGFTKELPHDRPAPQKKRRKSRPRRREAMM